MACVRKQINTYISIAVTMRSSPADDEVQPLHVYILNQAGLTYIFAVLKFLFHSFKRIYCSTRAAGKLNDYGRIFKSILAFHEIS